MLPQLGQHPGHRHQRGPIVGESQNPGQVHHRGPIVGKSQSRNAEQETC